MRLGRWSGQSSRSGVFGSGCHSSQVIGAGVVVELLANAIIYVADPKLLLLPAVVNNIMM